MMSIECPSCHQQISLQPVATIPDEQIMYMSLKTEGKYISARTVAGSIKNMDGLMREIAKDIGFKCHVFISSIEQRENELIIGFLIAKVK